MFDCFKKKQPERVSVSEANQKLLWCPLAQQNKFGGMKTRGYYEKKYPRGAIVHFTAGSSIESSMQWGRKQGYAFFGIGRDGKLYQEHPLDKHGWHAGKSSYKRLHGNVSDELVGIEIAAAGRLTKKNGVWYTYFGTKVPEERTRTITRSRYGDEQLGTYEAYTEEQEETLFSLLVWLKRNNPEVFDYNFVLGHDEVSPGRKNDPGGALSMGMLELRKKLWEFGY